MDEHVINWYDELDDEIRHWLQFQFWQYDTWDRETHFFKWVQMVRFDWMFFNGTFTEYGGQRSWTAIEIRDWYYHQLSMRKGLQIIRTK